MPWAPDESFKVHIGYSHRNPFRKMERAFIDIPGLIKKGNQITFTLIPDYPGGANDK